jgi:5,10-methylenetetrahydromethanopterin reductase
MDSSFTGSLGLALLHADVSAHAAAWAREAEAAGLGHVWVIEDYFHPGAFALAGAAAAVTERVVVGLGVVNPYTRHPALLAMETAALAGMAPGRVVLGLGSSNRRWVEEQMGIPFTTPLATLRECVAIVRALLRGERVTCRGERFTLDGVALESPPKAEVPVFLGVKGPVGLRLAAEVADGVHCSVLTSPAHVHRVRAALAAASAPRAVIAYLPVVVDDDRRRAREAVKPLLAHYLGLLHGQSILEDAGLPPARTEPFREAARGGAPAAHLVDDAMVETLAVAGTPADCRRALERHAAAGLDAAVAVIPRHADMREQIARLGRDLAPAWKELRWR